MNSKIFNKQMYKDMFFVALGSLVATLGVNLFLVNANLLSAGLSGITLIVQYVTGFSAGYLFFILNIPLFILSYKKLNKRFTFLSLIGGVTFSIGLIITDPLTNVIKIDDIMLLSMYGGVISGIGYGIVFSNRGSTGGLDIISAYIKKKYDSFDIGSISFVVNCIIVLVSIFFFGASSALYTLFSMYITSYLLDKVMKGFNKNKMILIISEKEDRVSNNIMEKLGRSVTFLYGKGGYKKQEKRILYCVVSLRQLPKLKYLVREIDGNAFISILDAAEVQGAGFNGSFL